VDGEGKRIFELQNIQLSTFNIERANEVHFDSVL